MGRTAVVTGGASGMGLDICRHLSRDAHRVAVLDLDGEGAERAAADLRERGGDAVFAVVDVGDRASVDRALGEVRTAFGPVEIMVTSAAIAEFVPFIEITQEQWDRMLRVDLTGTFHCIQAAIPDMMTGGWGRVVTISSSAGQVGSIRQGHYAAAKGGVIAMTKTVAREYGPYGITANVIPPFCVDTPMLRVAQRDGDVPSSEVMAATIPARRVGTGDDIGAVCAFLCSESASYVTGQVVAVNGGALL